MAFVGDYIGTIEEFIPGNGTYVENGKIYASNIGKVEIDDRERKIMIGKTNKISIGQTVLCEVVDLRKNMIVVVINKIIGCKNEVSYKAAIFVSNISDKYVEHLEDAFCIGDIVEAEVVKIENNLIDLSTRGKFGVVKAFCNRCRHNLIKKGDKLFCENCEKEKIRKTSYNYGFVKEIF